MKQEKNKVCILSDCEKAEILKSSLVEGDLFIYEMEVDGLNKKPIFIARAHMDTSITAEDLYCNNSGMHLSEDFWLSDTDYRVLKIFKGFTLEDIISQNSMYFV